MSNNTNRWRSVVVWPSCVSVGNMLQESDDYHDSAESAEAVLRMIQRDGLGGEGKVFPVSVRIEPPQGETPSLPIEPPPAPRPKAADHDEAFATLMREERAQRKAREFARRKPGGVRAEFVRQYAEPREYWRNK
jgi:hypothetical protein